MGCATMGWLGLRSLFDLSASLATSAAEVKSMVFVSDCGTGCGAGLGTGCFARATAAARVRARLMIIVERITPPSVFVGCLRIVRFSASGDNGFGEADGARAKAPARRKSYCRGCGFAALTIKSRDPQTEATHPWKGLR